MYKKIIPAKPHLYLNRFSFQKDKGSAHLWNRIFFYNNGREALVAALYLLGLEKSARILLPAYICRTVSDSLKQAGFELVFIDVEPNLLPSLDQLLEIISTQEIHGVLLVDYFGFLLKENSSISLSLKQAGVLVLIDRCHSSFTLNSVANERNIADAIIYSVRKTLPVKDGGVLFLSLKTYKRNNLNRNAWYKDFLFLLICTLEWFIYILGWPNIYSIKVDKIRKLEAREKENLDFHCHPGSFNIQLQDSRPSYLLFNQLNNPNYLASIAYLRRQNYIKLARNIKLIGLSTLFVYFDEQVVPQVLPISTPQGGLAEFLREKGVGAYNWPGAELAAEVTEFPKKYTNTISLNSRIVCLPIHQSINDKHIERMTELIKQWILTI